MSTIQGTVKHWDTEKGYGFITADADGKDYFCHNTAIGGGSLKVGGSVSFEVDHNDGKPKAKNVKGDGVQAPLPRKQGWMSRVHAEAALARDPAQAAARAQEAAAELLQSGGSVDAAIAAATAAGGGVNNSEGEQAEKRPRSVEEIRERLIEIYQQHRPQQVPHIDRLLAKFKGREGEVLAKAETLFKDGDPHVKRQRTGGGPLKPDEMRLVPGCKSTRYEILTEGTPGSKVAKTGMRATCHAWGTLLHNKKKFWCTHDDNEPFTYDVGKGDVIRGWDQGCIGMREGEVRRLVISSDDAYGNSGFALFGIDPGCSLVYVIQMIKLE
eukprot:TRINITY_DN56496_c0_g1_i1.p1 TRINITY_DN56496_c0_g1~~TRINITY_DN56496_c0_g1_i1.p1  ORF type:complete len:360 (+),score=135.99 TRINITY_DN56496_c0_g1_i1:104-1081(+)